MKATAERIEKNTVQLEIELEAEHFDRAVDRAFRKLVKQVNVPGFRRGKTPRVIFERYCGKRALYEEAMENLIPEAYLQAVRETGIEPVDRPEVEVVQAEEGKPVVLKATVLVKPEVELGQYKGIEVVRPSTTVTEEDVEKELELLRNRHAKLITLEEGKVEKGDIAVIDFVGRLDGEPFEGGEGNSFPLEIGSGAFVPGFEEQVIGMSPGETKEVEVVFPEDYRAENLAGKKAVFTVTVKEIRRKETAPLDDEFAKDVSEFDTLEELKKDIYDRLVKNAENRAKNIIRQEVVNRAVENAAVDIPPVMVSNQVAEMLHSLEFRLAAQGLTVDDYLRFTGSDPVEFKEGLKPEAEKMVKTGLVLDAIGRAEGIEATEEEINEEIRKIALQYQEEPQEMRAVLENDGRFNVVVNGIIREKVKQFLVDNAVILDDEGDN
jgi:trigger factor